MSTLALTSETITWDDGYDVGYLRTNDPRVVAVIYRDEAETPDWCGIDGVLDLEGSPFGCSCCETPLADAWENAERHFGPYHRQRAERYMRIFHNAEVRQVSSRVDRYAHLTLVTKVGEYKREDYAWLQAWLDGDVFGVGYGYIDSLSVPLDFQDYPVTMACHGFYGEDDAIAGVADYALTEAESLLTQPPLI